MSPNEELLTQVESLRNVLVSCATGGAWSTDQYKKLRRELLAVPAMKRLLPRFVAACYTLDDFWGFIKPKFNHYQERREFLRTEFTPALDYLEAQQGAPADEPITSSLKTFAPADINEVWQKALDRREDDPEGAITAARALLETTCKHILDQQGAEYDEDDDLPNLYRAAAQTLNLAPEQHHEEVFKRILGGCQSVVNGLGTLRNKLSDAHGRSPLRTRPAPRHAALAVNLAGSVAMFLAETFQAKNRPK
ncbi:abortive infection family protein [Anaeromyxobacter paludicola]|uniref:Abortive infection protein-like C-terminal domain-containing protein n=1 Tax=Anaeromyxobacter paludicola TaxID=2918171 RepID=A0ABM7X8Q1_9BACT|nr:abortive infection family protein [Anaeromyxobacter paludicola]BDG08223.1 hypothetical protein AMPC_13360 [Anaeromyxobacter paludicola]